MPIATFLNDAPVSQLRGLGWLALSDVGFIGGAAVTSDSGGGGTTVWTYGTSFPCRVDPIASGHSNEGVNAERLSDRSTHLVTTPRGTEVSAANRLAVTGRGTFEVTAVRTRTADPYTFFEAVQVS